MADYGLLGGLADGLKQGLLTYQTTQNIKQQRQMEGALHGLVQDEQGNWKPNALTSQTQQLQLQNNQDALDEHNGLTERSKGIVNTARLAFDQANAQDKTYNGPKGIEVFPDGLAGSAAKEKLGLLKPNIAGSFGIGKMAPLVAVRQEGVDINRDNQTRGAVKDIVDDHQLNEHTQRLQGMDRIKSQLAEARAGKFKDTSQLLGELNAEYNIAMTGSKNSALGKQERTEYTTASQTLANLVQTITSNPQSINSPEIFAQVEAQLDGLRGNYQKAYDARADFLQTNYSHNAEANKQQKQKISQGKSQYGSASNAQAPVDPEKAEYEALLKKRGG